MDVAKFESYFHPVLGDTGRWEGFKFLVGDLLQRERPVILETGTLREPGNWKGDGQSTRLWDWVVGQTGGMAISVDADMRACDLARRECPRTHVVCSDSVSFLRGWLPFKVDLLYLDSLGCDVAGEPDYRLWALHQAAELSSVWHKLPSGCLIASDDQVADGVGKPALTKPLLKALGIEPILDSYIIVWRKP